MKISEHFDREEFECRCCGECIIDARLGDVGKLKVNGRSGKKHKIQETFS